MSLVDGQIEIYGNVYRNRDCVYNENTKKSWSRSNHKNEQVAVKTDLVH